jgi:hypothetical protein
MNFAKQLRWLAMVATTVALMLAAAPAMQAQVAVGISADFAPPELPVYEQPICPGDGYIWTPGYWAWDPNFADYYWVPGTWVLPPQPGYLWTPGYWDWSGTAFVFYPGYWGPQVGFYGGINYGFGYFGHGYEGGRWEGGHFHYNRAVNNINVSEIHNVYNTNVVNRNETRVSFSGGNGGINARPTAEEQAARQNRHIGSVAAQQQQINAARADHSLRASENHGKPPIAATSHAGTFSDGVAGARSGGNYNPPANRGGKGGGREERPPTETAPTNRPAYVHPNDLPKVNRAEPPNSGDAKADQKYQQQLNKMYQKQEQEQQKLQHRQDQEHAKAAQKQPNEAQQRQMEQRHQQQTQQMEQRHAQQQQKTERQAPPPKAQPPHEPKH